MELKELPPAAQVEVTAAAEAIQSRIQKLQADLAPLGCTVEYSATVAIGVLNDQQHPDQTPPPPDIELAQATFSVDIEQLATIMQSLSRCGMRALQIGDVKSANEITAVIETLWPQFGTGPKTSPPASVIIH